MRAIFCAFNLYLFFITLFIPIITKEAVSSENRIALVIGNSRYDNAPHLKNTVRDADAVALALKETGFSSVTVASDLTLSGMISALRQFSNDVERADWAVIYYAGHGLEINGTNFLLPVDAKISSDRDASFEAINLGQILTAAEGAKKLRLVLLDACRENPFSFKMRRLVSSRSLSRGLARIEPEGGTIVFYAAKDGQVAWDGGAQNSPFATAFVKHVRTPGLEINRLFRKIRGDVIVNTDKRQEPFVYGSLPDEDFYFFSTEIDAVPVSKENAKSDVAKSEADALRKEQAEPLKNQPKRIDSNSIVSSAKKGRRIQSNRATVANLIDPKDRTFAQASRRRKLKIANAEADQFSSRKEVEGAKRPIKRNVKSRQVISHPRGKCTMFNGVCL